MRIQMRKILYLFVSLGFSFAHAGSYEDFFKAVQMDDARTVQALLQRGFDPNTRDPKGQHGLFLALREPSPKVARTLIDWPQTEVEARSAEDVDTIVGRVADTIATASP